MAVRYTKKKAANSIQDNILAYLMVIYLANWFVDLVVVSIILFLSNDQFVLYIAKCEFSQSCDKII